MTAMTVRAATGDDTDALVGLWKRCGLTRPWNDPAGDIEIALGWEGSTILVVERAGAIVASAMTGFDGHRGWIYYVACDPDHRGKGLARRVMDAAERWLVERGAPKVEVILRAENTAVVDVYQAFGYRTEPRILMSKWLKEPPAAQTEEPSAPKLPVTITWLEMRQRPTKPVRPPPALPNRTLSLQRVQKPSVPFYRFLQHTVGDPWLWWERRTFTDETLARIVQDDRVEIYVLSVNGEPAGFVELDFRDLPDSAEIAYFGLMPHFIGGGIGPYLLEWAIDCAWNREPAPERLLVNTCTLDHPAALAGYQKAGFVPFRRETKTVEDPVARGIIPKHVEILSPPYRSG